MLRVERVRAGLTQMELSRKLERPQSFVSKYERGERRLDVIEFLEVARVLGFDAARFIERLQQDV
jgi:transcriptional regulator with XRE-family HTH domain